MRQVITESLSAVVFDKLKSFGYELVLIPVERLNTLKTGFLVTGNTEKSTVIIRAILRKDRGNIPIISEKN